MPSSPIQDLLLHIQKFSFLNSKPLSHANGFQPLMVYCSKLGMTYIYWINSLASLAYAIKVKTVAGAKKLHQFGDKPTPSKNWH
ncbi:MAG: hypothetical protein H0V82_04715 [Candidatus Protochlamydia sp.]|nr:hypothetical protein [Candidatus Protochlamydia sp.]